MIDIPDELPDRASIELGSPHFIQYGKKVGVTLNGMVLFHVVEYCVSEGWVRIGVTNGRGKMKTERGKAMTITKQGEVKPYWR